MPTRPRLTCTTLEGGQLGRLSPGQFKGRSASPGSSAPPAPHSALSQQAFSEPLACPAPVLDPRGLRVKEARAPSPVKGSLRSCHGCWQQETEVGGLGAGREFGCGLLCPARSPQSCAPSPCLGL